ncbi:monomethylamine:corrinoid methyltransferase [Candidatus Bathyarchaeota archaeon]|nr:monomethylamine:corrinoid methyltransferase [Candidatus Bathyarchaeota archaeon]
MTAPNFWEILDRACNTGPETPVRDFDMKIFRESQRLVEEHGIKYDPEIYVPSDDSLADEVWDAGMALFLETGVYCMNSRRVIRFTEDETREALRDVRSEVEIGQGGERRLVTRRGIEGEKPPIIIGGVIESDINEGENFVKLYQAIAQEPLIDGLYVGPPVHTSEGYTLRMGSPLEVHLGRTMAAWAREAIRRAGRPGLHYVSACPSAIADIAGCNPENGTRPSDGIMISVTSELKTNYDALAKVAYALDYGCVKATHGGSIIGGWAGGPEGAAVVSIADFLAAAMVYHHRISPTYGDHGLTRCPGPVPVSSVNPGMWGTELTGQAIARNYNGLNGRFFLTAAGPGTEMQLWEIAALGIAALASGRDMFCGGGIRRYKVKLMLGSALENRFHAELAHAALDIAREDADELVKQIVAKYTDKVTKDGGPWGHTFQEIHNTRTLTVRPEYQAIADKVKNELTDMGLNFQY